MSISVQISPRLVTSIASLYNDTNRIFMEYIDNSIDSAEEFFDKDSNAYKRNIEITLTIKGSSCKDGKVTILDNCTGITNFTKVVQNIGNSDKKAQPWTNGQFGYGIYSFMAACESLEITSKLEYEEKALYLLIERKQFDKERQEDVKFRNPKEVMFTYKSGTEVVLTDFNKDMWNQIELIEMKNEIERHFELLLSRKNLKITIIDQSNKKHLCKPFNYEEYDGEIYKDKADKLHFTKGRKSPNDITYIPSEPISVFLKITKGKAINKPPVFVIKGRRIAEIKDIKQFKSQHKSTIWGHPNMTGLVDLSDFLEPTIARNDFVNNDKSKALFNYLCELEPVILDVIKDVNKEAETQHYQVLEDQLNQALSKLARIDTMKYRVEYVKGNNINLQQGEGLKINEEKDGGNDVTGNGKSKGNSSWERSLEGSKGLDSLGNIPGGGKNGNSAHNKEAENPFEDTGFKGEERKRSGFNIKIVDIEPLTDINNKSLRSHLIGGEIRIFKKHKDFENRVESSRKGDAKITQRLITYLAGEITVHYKDQFHNKSKTQPLERLELFTDLTEFIYNFESMLKDLAGKNLADFSG